MQRFCILFLLLALSACKTRRAAAPSQPVTIQQPAKDSVIEGKSIAAIAHPKFALTLLLALNAQQYFEKDSLGNYVLPEMESVNLSALQFYEGLLLAKEKNDSLIKLRIADTGIDSLKLVKLLKDSALRKSDLVLSIAGPSISSMILKMAVTQEIPLCISNYQSPAQAKINNKIWAINSSNKTQCRMMAAYLKSNYPNAAYSIIYRNDVKKEVDLADLFNDELHNLFNDSISRKINYAVDGWNNLLKNLKSSQRNILIIPSSDESFLSSLLVKLDTQEQFSFLVVGLPTWEHFESIDLSLLESLNTHIFNANYLDYDNENVKRFRKRFIEEYHTDPLFSAYSGYDIYKWIEENDKKYGNAIEKYESITSLTAPVSGFEFTRSCNSCGFENQYISVLLFKDGALKKVNP